ncbi:MAG: DNA adenine methylase [Campylobacterales bacterium]|nr:DNA adenine methylase [Campylobacterales bacterium]
MNYIGSKGALAPFILSSATLFAGTLHDKTVCDLFGGTGSVAEAFGLTCKALIANDVEPYSALWLHQRLCGVQTDEALLEQMRQASCEGIVCEHFSPLGEAKRGYFTPQNARKIDGARAVIVHHEKHLARAKLQALLASLLDGADRVANTTSVYGSFLKHTKFTATQALSLRALPATRLTNATVHNREGLALLEEVEGDILYLDPPYNHRQYGLNYHVLNAIARNEARDIKGKSGFGNYYRSRWCQKRGVEEELRATLKTAKFRYILMSYNDEGLLGTARIREIFEEFGRYDCVSQAHPRLRTSKKSPKKETIETLHLLEKES